MDGAVDEPLKMNWLVLLKILLKLREIRKSRQRRRGVMRK